MLGVSTKFVGVWGGRRRRAHPALGHRYAEDGAGVVGVSTKFVGVWGKAKARTPASGKGTGSSGVVGESVNQIRVTGVSTSSWECGQKRKLQIILLFLPREWGGLQYLRVML